jgi:Mg-chelatase subunit ChlD
MKRILFDVPRWTVFQHRSARGLAFAESDDSAQKRFEDELFDKLYSGEPELLPEEHKSKELREWAEKVHAACDQLPDFGRLAQDCRGDPDAAGLAVDELMAQLVPPMHQAPDQIQASTLRRALNAACGKAADAIDQQREAVEALGGIGWGTSSGLPGATANTMTTRNLASRLKRDRRLARIAELAGRFKRIALAKQRSKVKHGHDEVSDVELGADLGRLLPSELSRLLKPTQRLALLRDLSERRCMQYQLTGAEPLGKGPLVVLLDKSGSMEGEKDIWATAVSLALLEIAQRQRRMFALLAFESLVRDEQVVCPGDALPEQALFTGCGGGTDIAGALTRGLQLIRDRPGKLRKADVVLITDGWSDSDASAALREQARELGVTVLGAAIGVGEEVLAPWCDQTCAVQQLESLDDNTATQLLAI